MLRLKKFCFFSFITLIFLFTFVGCGEHLPPYESTSVLSYEIVSHYQIKFSWTEDVDAVKYEIYESGEEDGTYASKQKTIQKGEGCTCTVSVSSFDKPMYFYITSINEKDQKSNSNIVKVIPAEHPFTTTVLIASCEDSNSVKLSWLKIKDTEFYNVYYGSDYDTSTMKIYCSTEDTSCIVEGLSPEDLYYFSVRAIQNGVEQDFSEIEFMRLKVYTLPVAKLTAVDIGAYSFTLEWGASYNAPYYFLCLRNGKKGFWHDDVIKADVTEKTSYTFTSLESDKEYWVYVYAFVNEAKAKSYLEDPDSIKNKSYMSLAISAEKSISVKTQIPGIAIPAQISATTTCKPLRVSWTKVVDSTHYTLYFSTTNDITTAAKIICKNPWYELNAYYGDTYYFWVSSGTDTLEGEISEPVKGYVPTEKEFEELKKQNDDNGGSGGGSSGGSSGGGSSAKHSYSYYISQYKYYIDRANYYYKKALDRLAKGDRTGYKLYLSMYNGERLSAEKYLELALQAEY